MSLYHVSYDVKDSAEYELFKKDLIIALICNVPDMMDLTEPVRSTLRFSAEGGKEGRGRVFSALNGLSKRCYFFVSCSEPYIEDGASYFPSRTVPNEELNKNFQTYLAEIKRGMNGGGLK